MIIFLIFWRLGHFTTPPTHAEGAPPTQYERAIMGVGGVLEYYDHDKVHTYIHTSASESQLSPVAGVPVLRIRRAARSRSDGPLLPAEHAIHEGHMGGAPGLQVI